MFRSENLDVAKTRENMAIIYQQQTWPSSTSNKATTTKPLKSTSQFWKPRSAYAANPWTSLKLKLLGSKDPLVADSFDNVGLAYEKKGDLENALVRHQKGS